ncbi:MAG: LemA family protein [Christensenellales bacterium]|jgi:LemA protein
MLPGLIIGGVLIILVIWFISSYNGFVKLKNMVEEAFATMDVYLKKRYDLIPNLVETVKGYASHEKETLEKVIAARNMAAGAASVEDRLEGENALTGTLRTLFAVAESYPDLKANQNFMDLQRQLQSIEGEIANSRKYYNAVVKEFNTKRQVFPSSIVAGIFKFEKQPMFEIASEQRENVRVQF